MSPSSPRPSCRPAACHISAAVAAVLIVLCAIVVPARADECSVVDWTSTIECAALPDPPVLRHNQSIQCEIRMKCGDMTVGGGGGHLTDFRYCSVALSPNSEPVSPSSAKVGTPLYTNTQERSAAVVPGRSDANSTYGVTERSSIGASAVVSEFAAALNYQTCNDPPETRDNVTAIAMDVSKGIIYNWTLDTEQQIIHFTFRTPVSGNAAILQVLIGDVDIDQSPINIWLSEPPPPPPLTPAVTQDPPFFSLGNPTFLFLIVTAAVIAVSVTALWSCTYLHWKRIQRARIEADARDSLWLNSVGHLTQPLNV